MPWCSIIIRKVFGVAGAAHTARTSACTTATRGRPATGARCRSRAGSRPPIAPSSTRRPIRDKLRDRDRGAAQPLRSPFRTAETFLIEEIIDPRDTRPLLCEFANLTAKLREAGPVATPDAAVKYIPPAATPAQRNISVANASTE